MSPRHRRPLRLLLGRRRPIKLLPYSGPASCGCRVLNGDVVVPCDGHAATFGVAPAGARPQVAR